MGLGTWLLLGGVALINHATSKNNNNYYNNDDDDDDDYDDEEDREEDERLSAMEREQEILERQRQMEREKERELNRKMFPNSMENIKERVDSINALEILLWMIILWVFLFALIGLFAYLDGEGNYIIGTIVLSFIGILLIKKCLNIHLKKKLYMKYISLIIVQGERSIVNIANIMNKSLDEAYNDILYIISKDYIRGFTINRSSNMIINNMKNESNMNYQESNQKNRKCPSCGGTSIEEVNGEWYCKYCGTKI